MNRVLKKSVFLSLAAILSLGAYGQASTQSYSVADPYTAETFAQIFKVETKIATNGNISFDMTLGDGGQETLHLGGLDLADPVFSTNLQALRGSGNDGQTRPCGGALKASGDDAGTGTSLFYLAAGMNGPVTAGTIESTTVCELVNDDGPDDVIEMMIPTGRLVTISSYVGPDAQIKMEDFEARTDCLSFGNGRYGGIENTETECGGIYHGDGSLVAQDANGAQSIPLNMDDGGGSVSFIIMSTYRFIIEDPTGVESTAFDSANSSAHVSRNEADAGFRYVPSDLNLFYN